MANIRQYENTVPGLQPDERGIDANLQSARRAGAFYNQAGEAVSSVGEQVGRNVGSAIKDAGDVAVQYVDYQDRSKINALATGGMAKAEQDWNDVQKQALKDPN